MKYGRTCSSFFSRRHDRVIYSSAGNEASAAIKVGGGSHPGYQPQDAGLRDQAIKQNRIQMTNELSSDGVFGTNQIRLCIAKQKKVPADPAEMERLCLNAANHSPPFHRSFVVPNFIALPSSSDEGTFGDDVGDPSGRLNCWTSPFSRHQQQQKKKFIDRPGRVIV